MTRLRTWFAALLVGAVLLAQHAAGQSGNPVVTVSAASFEARVAPDSIVAAFGTRLAVRTEAAGGLLPTTLAGTTVRVNGRLAALFFVSSGQVNFVLPAETQPGQAAVVVNSGDGVTSNGTVETVRAAPGVFTANGDGQGVPAGSLVRVRADGAQSFEPLARFDQPSGRFVAVPIDPGAANDRLFLVLFPTGARGAAAGTVNAVIGGQTVVPLFVGPAPGFVGLDQVNLEIPRSLVGRGRVNLALNVVNAGASNSAEVEIAGPAGGASPQIAGFNAPTALAGDALVISGAGFASVPAQNLVRIGGIEARVVTATATQLMVTVPFGARSGAVSVRTPQGEGASANSLRMRTSVSGLIEDTNRQPLNGVTVRLLEAGITARTGAAGSFILPDAPASASATLEISAAAQQLPYPVVRLKVRVLSDRDNQLSGPVPLQAATGPSLNSSGTTSEGFRLKPVLRTQTQTQTPISGRLQNNGVVFEVPAGAAVSFPDDAARNLLSLDLVESGRTPVNLPPGQFSSAIAQLTPFGARLLPGGKLTFPNRDGYAPGAQVTLFRLVQARNDPRLGEFVEAGTAIVSADGQRIETALGTITELTIYFVSNVRPTTTVVGRVVDADGTPVRQALVRCRGQESFSDGNGGFILRGVQVSAGDLLAVEASFVRASGRVERTQRTGIPANVGGVTAVTPDLILPAEQSNRAPVVLAPTNLAISTGETRDAVFAAGDPDGDALLPPGVTGANFAAISPRGNGVFTLRLQPQANDAGRYTLRLTVADNQNAATTLNLTLTVNSPPTANPQTVTTDEDTARALTLTGSDPEGDPLGFVVVSNRLRGRLSGTPPNLSYQPPENFNGNDSFTFQVNDGLADSSPATVSIIVNPVNDPPTLIVPGTQNTNEGENVTFTVTAIDVEPDQILTVSATNLPGGANFPTTMGPSGTAVRFSWTPNVEQVGAHTVSFTVRDNGVPARTDTKTVTLVVQGRWRQTAGPNGGRTTALLLNGTTLFAGTYGGGVFRSLDQGQNWTAVNNGLTDRAVQALVVSGPNLFAGTDGSGIFRSANNGESWTKVNPGLTDTTIPALAVSGTTLFAGTFRSGVFRSTDQGGNWTAASAGLPVGPVPELAASGAEIFAGVFGGGVFRSSDQGRSWTAVNAGLPSLAVESLTASSTNLFAAIDSSSGRGVFRLTDFGRSWVPVNNGLNPFINVVLANGSELLAGSGGGVVFRSTDQGASWSSVPIGLTGANVLSLAASGASYFAGANGSGVFRTLNQGRNWEEANRGLTSAGVPALTVSGGRVLAGTFANGVSVTFNDGQNWLPTNAGLTELTVNALALSGANLFAGTAGGVFFSPDLGQSWTPARAEPLPNTITALLLNGGDLFAGSGGAGVFRSSDNGRSWTAVNAGIANTIINDLAASGELFAATAGNGIFRSADRGQSWTAVNTGLTNLEVEALAASGTTLFAGTDGGGVFRSTDRGQNWTAVNQGLTDRRVQALVVAGTNLFAATDSSVFVSFNQGQNWAVSNTGLEGIAVISFAVGGTQIFAGTTANGVFVRRL